MLPLESVILGFLIDSLRRLWSDQWPSDTPGRLHSRCWKNGRTPGK